MATHETDTDEVRMFFGVGAIEFGDRSGEENRNATFDRWLARELAEAKVAGVEEASERLVLRDQFSDRTLRLLDELVVEIRQPQNGATT